MLPAYACMSNLYSQLEYSAVEFQDLQFIFLVMFGAVAWFNQLQ